MDRPDVFRVHSKMLQLAKDYLGDVQLMRLRINQQTVRTCYATGGKNMGSRGMYSPSLALKYLVGNAVPGRLLKRQPQKLRGHYMFAFDETNRIIYAKQFVDEDNAMCFASEEFIFYCGNDQFSGVYQGGAPAGTPALDAIILCESWNTLPTVYSQLHTYIENDFCAIEIEQYEYEHEKLSRIEWCNLFRNEKNEYEGGGCRADFFHDEHGNMGISDPLPRLMTSFRLPK